MLSPLASKRLTLPYGRPIVNQGRIVKNRI